MTDLSTEAKSGPFTRTPFKFTGDGSEYFKIWIVNVLLTAVTLGIYSAWATVRNNRYMHSNLYLEDNNFRYLAEPIAILKGRIIAVVALIVYAIFAAISPSLAGLFILILFALMPYFFNQSFAFKMRMTSYKNIQFRFNGTYGGAAMILFVWPMLGMLTFGILMPKALQKSNEYIVNNSSYGNTKFKFSATYGDYGKIFLILLAGVFAFGAILALIGAVVPQLAVIFPLLVPIFYLTVIGFLYTSTTNLFYQRLSLAEHEFDCNLSIPSFIKVILINVFLIMITLGLYAPAAQIRMAKYLSENIVMKVNGDLNDFTAAEKVEVGALGEEMGQAFDFA